MSSPRNSVVNVQPAVITSSRNTSQTMLKASDIYRPILSILRFIGSFYFCSTKSEFTLNRALQIFCYFVQLIVVSGTIRYLSVFRTATNEMYEMVGLVAFTWYYLCETSSSIGLLYLNNKHIKTVCNSIDKYWEKYGMETNVHKTCKLVRMLSIFSVIFSIIYQVMFVSSYLINDAHNSSLVSSLFTPFEEERGATYIIVFVIITVVNILYHEIIFSNILFVLINMYIFTTEFKGIRNKVRCAIEENNLKKLTQLRIQHQHIASVQDTANLIFRFTVLNVYCFGLPIVCLMLYGATSQSFESADVIAMLSTLIGAVIGMFVLTFMGAQLNQTVSIFPKSRIREKGIILFLYQYFSI